jgi:hypothetical protein
VCGSSRWVKLSEVMLRILKNKTKVLLKKLRTPKYRLPAVSIIWHSPSNLLKLKSTFFLSLTNS